MIFIIPYGAKCSYIKVGDTISNGWALLKFEVVNIKNREVEYCLGERTFNSTFNPHPSYLIEESNCEDCVYCSKEVKLMRGF
jgi:hypothetical protein